MNIKDYSHDELKSMAAVEVAKLILLDEKKAMNFKDIFDKIAELRELTETQKQDKIVQFYTDLNLDGRFITLGSNTWGLKRWYPVGQIDEEVTVTPKKKKKATKKKKETVIEEETVLEDEGLDIVDGDIEEVIGGFEDEEVDDGFDDILDEELDEDFDEDDEDEKDDEEK